MFLNEINNLAFLGIFDSRTKIEQYKTERDKQTACPSVLRCRRGGIGLS